MHDDAFSVRCSHPPRNRNVSRWLIALSILAFLLLPAPAEAAETVEQKVKEFRAESKVRFEGDLTATWTDNLFHYSDERLDDFDRLNGPDQRFEDLEDPEDIVTRARLGITYKKTFAKKRDFKFEIAGARYLHQKNDIADYSEFEMVMKLDATRKDRFFFGVEHIPDRFKKNYLKERIGLTNVFAPATYDEMDYSFGYEREFSKRWNGGLVFHMRDRSFNDDFADRDQDEQALEAYASVRLVPRVWSVTTVGYGQVDTPTGRDLGVNIDRSFDESSLGQEFRFETRNDVSFGIGAEFRRREYTTGVRADTARYNRTDDRLRATFKSEIPLNRALSLLLRAGWTDNDSVREDAGFEVDEGGYEELEGGIGLRLRF